MARTFPDPPLALSIPLRTTWEERWQLFDDATDDPIDLTGYEVRMQLRDRRTGEAVLSLDSADGATSDGVVTITAVDGLIELVVGSDIIAAVSPLNTKRATKWDAELYQAGSPEYVIPFLRGSAVFTPRYTLAATP